MKRFVPFVLTGLLVSILLMGPASSARADDKLPPPGSQEQETIDVLPPGAVINQTVKNPPKGLGQIYLLEETFEGLFPEDNGWTVYDCNGSGNGEYFWDDTNYKWWGGGTSGWSAWPASGGANGFIPNDSLTYPANMCTWMINGPYDLRGVASGSFHLQYWLQSEASHDYLKYMVSTDGVHFYGYIPSGDHQTWQVGNIDLSNVPTLVDVRGDSSVWFGIKFESDASTQYKGAYVDSVYVEVLKNCYRLFQYVGTGNGTPSTASPTSSGTCNPGYYYAGEVITLTAHPDPGWVVSSWDGTNNDSLTTLTNTVTMPAQDQLIVVNYSISKTFISDASRDGWILESGENSNAGGTLNSTAPTLYVGDNAQDKQIRSILSFNTSYLPDNAEINKVTLKLKLQGTTGTNPFNSHGTLYMDIKNGGFGASSILTISDFQAAASKNSVGVIPKTPVSGWYTKTWTGGIFSYISLDGWTQFRLRFSIGDDDDLLADYLRFYSGNAAMVYRPKLTIEYSVP